MARISFEDIVCVGREYGPHILILFNNFNECSIKNKYVSSSVLTVENHHFSFSQDQYKMPITTIVKQPIQQCV